MRKSDIIEYFDSRPSGDVPGGGAVEKSRLRSG